MDIGGERWPDQWRLYHAPLSEIGAVTGPIFVDDTSRIVTPGAVQRMAVSATTVAAELQPQGQVLLFEGGAWRFLGGAASPTPGYPQDPHLVGRTVWWEEWGHPVSLVIGAMDREATYFLRNVPDDALMLQVVAHEIAWMQGYGFVRPEGYARLELWMAPYTEDAPSLRARKVRDLDHWNIATGGGGEYAFPRVTPGTTRRHIEVYDLADGRRRIFEPPAGGGILDNPLYITSQEMLVLGVLFDTGDSTLYRVQLASLPYDG